MQNPLDSDTNYAEAHTPSSTENWCPPEGDPTTAKIALVGEAPGLQERRLRRPFCGPSGQLLDKLLLRAGINRRDLYITNTIKEQPERNDITPFLDLSKKVPREGEKWDYYCDLLKRELESSTANVIVAVGAVPLWALCGAKAITKRRGSILESTLLPGRKVIPIIHPAAALREYMFTHVISWDLKRIKREAEFPEICRKDNKLLLGPSYDEVISFVRQLCAFLRYQATNAYTEIDIEVLNEEISCLCVGHEDFGTITIPFVCDNGDYFSPEEEEEIWSVLTLLLEDSNIKKLGHNITFDATFIFRKLGIRTFPVLDTMVAQGVAFPDAVKKEDNKARIDSGTDKKELRALRLGLDFVTSIYTDEPYYKDDGKKWFKLGGSPQDLWRYNAKDGAVLPEIHRKQLLELRKQKNEHAYEMQLQLIEPLVYMGERGIRCDTSGLKKASIYACEELDCLVGALHELCGFELNPASPKQLAEYFYETKKFKPYLNRKSGAVSTDRDALKRLARKGSKEASLLLEIRKLSKLKGTYLDIKLDPDSRLRCAFNPIGTSSGRLSSSQTIFGTGGNMQNLPSDFKQFLQFDSGFIGYNVDLSQAENRTVAWVAPDELMMRAFQDGLDIHSLTGSLIFNIPYQQVKEEDERGIFCEIGGGIYTRRFWGKKANHGLNYDLGFRTFAFYYEIPEREAQFIVERYHRAYPGVRQYHAWVRNKLSQGRTLENCLGRKRLFLDRWGDDLFKEAYSFIPQSSIADKVNHHGLIPLYYDSDFRKVDILNQVHDSLVFQIPLSLPIEKHVEILLNLRSRLEEPITFDGRSFSIPMDIEAAPEGGNLGKFHPEKNALGLHKCKGRTQAELAREVRSIVEQAKIGG